MREELESWKTKVDELRGQLATSQTDYTALERRMEEQQTQIALQRSHMKKQLADQRKRSTTVCRNKARIPRRRHRHPRENHSRHVRHARFPEVISVAS